MNNLKKIGLLAAVAAVMGVASYSADAADVFAEPVAAKGQAGYSLSVFPNAGDEGVSFVIQLEKGLKGVDVSKCGRDASDGVARCRYEPLTGKLAVVLFRLDGQALNKQEYSLGEVTFASSSLLKLAPFQVTDVVAASRGTARQAKR